MDVTISGLYPFVFGCSRFGWYDGMISIIPKRITVTLDGDASLTLDSVFGVPSIQSIGIAKSVNLISRARVG